MPPSEKLVLLRLADHANPDGGDVYPSVASVAASTGISARQVQRYIKGFVERGVLVITGHEKGGRSNPREYRFTFRSAPRKGDTHDTVSTHQRVTPTTPFHAQKGDTQRTKRVTPSSERVTPMTQKGDTAMSPEPSGTVTEPSVNREGGARRPKRPHPLPDHFDVTDEMYDWAGDEVGMLQAEVDQATAKFRDHYAARSEQRVDWAAEWRNWIRREDRFRMTDPVPPARASPGRRTGNGWSARDFADYARELEREGR